MVTVPTKNQPVLTVRKFGMRDKLGYMFGDLGNDFFFILVSSFLMVYYTDIFNINAATVGLLFLIARLWDAVADVAWGRFIDTRKASPHGKFRPWIFRMSFPLVFSGVLMFIKIPGMSDGFYLTYAFVTYLVWGTLYSTVNIPYGSMASVITNNPIERTQLSTFRTTGAILASVIINVIGPLILFVDNKADENRFLIAAIIFGILSIGSYLACYHLSTERIKRNEINKDQLNFKNSLKALTKNKPFIAILTISLFFMMLMMLVGAINVYLFKDYFASTSALSLAGLVQMATMVMAIPLVKPLVAKFGKKEVSSVGLFLASIVYLALSFMTNLSPIQFVLITAIASFGMAFFYLVLWAFVTDIIDYHEYLTGLREDGTVYSVYSFARKVGQAIAGGLGGVAIAIIGYNSSAEIQQQSVLDNLYKLSTLLPGVIFLIIALLLVFIYPLNKKKTNEMVAELAARANNKK